MGVWTCARPITALSSGVPELKEHEMPGSAEGRKVREELLLAALESLSFGVEWVDADQVARHVNCGQPPEAGWLTAIGAGRMLSRFAREGRVDVRDESYMNYYRSLDVRRPIPSVGELLVPKDTPAGPAHARVAWAAAVDTLRTVLGVERDGLDVAFGQAGEGERVLSMEELAAEYERADGKPIGEGSDDAVAEGVGDHARERTPNDREGQG